MIIYHGFSVSSFQSKSEAAEDEEEEVEDGGEEEKRKVGGGLTKSEQRAVNRLVLKQVR